MTSPTGRRVIPFEHIRRQEEAAWIVHQRLRAAVIASGAKEVYPDMFEISAVDYSAIERRIMETMNDDSRDGVDVHRPSDSNGGTDV